METESKRTASYSKEHDNGPPEIELATGQVVMGLPDMPMKRKFSILSIIAVGYNISNSWVAIATSFAIAVQSGGAVSLLYGIVAVTVAMLCTGLTLAELASVYPTAGGQYHFTSILASEGWSRSLSYFSGLAAVFSWITLAASIAVASTQALMAIVIRWQPEYVPQEWHYFLVYQLFNVVMVVYNIFLTNRTLWVYNAGCTLPSILSSPFPGIYFCILTSHQTVLLSLGTFLAITITCPARSHTEIDSFAIWTQFTNGSGGWPNGISFLTGLSTPQFMLSGLDATLHLAEECLEPERIVPKAVLVTVVVGFLTAFPFSIAIIYSYRDVESSLSSPTGCVFSLLPSPSVITTTATYLWTLCLDSPSTSSGKKQPAPQQQPQSSWPPSSLSPPSPSTQSTRPHPDSPGPSPETTPSSSRAASHPSIHLSTSPSTPFSWTVSSSCLSGLYTSAPRQVCLAVATSTNNRDRRLTRVAFNAFIGTTVIVAQISFAVPAALLIYRRRSAEYLPPSRPFKVPRVVGYVCNVVTIVWAVVITVFFTFPTTFPVTGGNMSTSFSIFPLSLGTVFCR
jgi:choline transport protein